MTQDRDPTHLRKLRAFPWLWRMAFLLLVGPFNPVAWLLARPKAENTLLTGYDTMVPLVLVPCTIMATVILLKLSKKPQFAMSDTMAMVLFGWLIAVATSPIILTLSALILGEISGSEVLGFLIVVAFFGVLFGVIPFFAFVIGAPCALVAFPLIWMMSQQVATPAIPRTDNNPSQTG